MSTTPEDFPIIQSDRYRILSVLGVGAVGTVYKAEDTVLNITVAIKKLHKTALSTEAVRFHREAKLAGTLKHPNVLSVLDFGVTEGDEPYLVLTLVEGKSLSDRIKYGEALQVREALDIFIQIARGLIHAHNKNVIHRDIKPSNIMLVENSEMENETVRIVDFGLAKSTVDQQELTGSGVTVGTPMFMSPEQIKGESLDARSDIYSFGCLMYEVLTGETPFKSDSMVGLIDLHLNEEPEPVSEKARYEIPESLAAIVHKCLKKNKEERYCNAIELLTDLESVVIDEPIFEDTGQEIVEAPKPVAQSNWLVIAIIAVVLVSLVPVLWITISSTPEEKPPEYKGAVLSKFSFPRKNPNWIKSDEVNDQDLKAFLEVHGARIDELILRHSTVTSKGLRNFRSVRIKNLCLRSMAEPITDDMFKAISTIESLQTLRIYENDAVDYRGLRYLTTLSNLTELDLQGRQAMLTEEGLKAIGRLTQLERIEMKESTGISGDKLKYLSGLKNLDTLFLDNSDVSDEGIVEISRLPIKVLSLDFTNLGNKTLETLATMPSLKKVNFTKTDRATPEAIQDFVDKHPQLEIHWKADDIRNRKDFFK